MINVVTDREVIRHILDHKGAFSAFFGAGASVEARVPSAWEICDDVLAKLCDANPGSEESEIKQRLRWDDSKRRYSACLQNYGGANERCEYFRRMLRGKRPCFAHYALSLLISRAYLKATCFTTNFDKLIETAFAEDGALECQAIRAEEEAAFHNSDVADKAYVVKLHGDYDTSNILNTRDETIEVPEILAQLFDKVVTNSGMVVVGAAGNEESVRRMFDRATNPKDSRIKLSLGLYWGVFVGTARQEIVRQKDAEELVSQAIRKGAVNEDIVEMMNRASTSDRPCAFFPIWGAGSFFYSLMLLTKEKSLIGRAVCYLDHEMRLRHVLGKAGLNPDALETHLAKLREQREKIDRDDAHRPFKGSQPDLAASWTRTDRAVTVRVLYGDITSRSLMGATEFSEARRAVVSPEDTCISAGGGVAFGLLEKAGSHTILNELGKLAPIAHRSVAVTSGGLLPLHYIIHAAAIQIRPDASYSVSQDDVLETASAALRVVSALDIGMVLFPLLAAGLGPLTPLQSLEAILEAIERCENLPQQLTVQIVIYQEKQIPRREVDAALASRLGPSYVADFPVV